MQSANNTLIGRGQSITDAEGNVWAINTDGRIEVNGVVDSTTANVTHLAYANGLVWQENSHDLWWSKASPAAPWTARGTTVPVTIATVSRNETVLATAAAFGPVGAIVDRGGNTWSITNGQVAVNGVIDPTTANVTELAYVNGKIWQENSHGSWWAKATPADNWGPPNGTTTNPLTGSFYIGNPAGDFAVVDVGELTASPEGGMGIAPQSTSEIVTPGVLATGTAITVSTETATLVVNGNSTLANGATLNLIGAYRTPSEISAPLQNNGVMTVNHSTLEIGALSGQGSIKASNASTLDVQSSNAGNTVQLQASHLHIGGQGGVAGGLSFLAPITMDSASSIILNQTQATSETLKPLGGSINELLLYNGTTEVADLKIGGVSTLYATATGSGSGAAVTLSATPNANDLHIVGHMG
ncbi:hypothetical protein [Rhodopila sp.]|uniref:hypothetical protein n=1 Tax=Rhodopila sp. TaxID=2480087 RepID=UPI003D131715